MKLFEVVVTPAGPDEGGLVHLMRDLHTKHVALCGAELTGDIVPEDCPIDCAMCAYEHGGEDA